MEQGLVYVEYISRLPGVPLAEFQRVLIQAQQSWASGHGEDRLLLSAGRTWRLGPEPEYLHVLALPRHGLQRLDDWDAIFRAGEAERHAQTVGRVSRIDRAGCYRALLPSGQRGTLLRRAVPAHWERGGHPPCTRSGPGATRRCA